MNDQPVDGAPDAEATVAPRRQRSRGLVSRGLPWLITVACFTYLYTKVAGAAAREDLGVVAYLARAFAGVDWWRWLALMVPYSFLFFLIDTLVVWRVVNWFNTRVPYADMLPIRGSSYILSIVNEQVGKGAMGLYLYRRYGVPGWEVGSSMLFIMFCEFYYLLGWATIGWGLRRDTLPAEFDLIPVVASIAALFFVLWIVLFRSGGGRPAERAEGPEGAGDEAGPGGEAAGLVGRLLALRDRPVFKSFREAPPIRYGILILLRSPAIVSAVFVYTWALQLFGVEVDFVEMLGYLPVIFFGAATPGPMRTVAITLWVVLFPGHEGQMTAFGFVQHNFFIFFNAAIGLVFLRRANRELFG